MHLPLLEQACAVDPGPVSTIVAVGATMLVAGAAALLVYVVIPPDGATLRQAFVPAALVGVVIGLFTSLFGWLAPLLMRQWLTLGIVGSVFISLIWFDLIFQALVYGAALARMRRDVSRRGSRRPGRSASRVACRRRSRLAAEASSGWLRCTAAATEAGLGRERQIAAGACPGGSRLPGWWDWSRRHARRGGLRGQGRRAERC